MKEIVATINLPEGLFNAKLISFEESDRKKLFKIYKEWRSLCNDLNKMCSRGVNLPEGLSESAFCLEMNFLRTNGNIIGANSSFDSYDPTKRKRIQIKACSVIPDLTSFGPNSVWDELYFVDFYRDGKWDGKFDIYHIDNLYIYNINVNKNQTFTDQQEQSRRPRFSIYKEIIEKNKLKPIHTGDLSY